MSALALMLALAAADNTPAPASVAAPMIEATQTPGQQTTSGQSDDEVYELDDIVVTTTRRGTAIGDPTPEATFDEEQIRTFGAGSITELLTLIEPQTRSARGGSPVFLVNGRRISGFQEIQGIPPEAIERLDVLPEEAALAYGYTADQRVVNFVLKANFRSVTTELQSRRSEQGGRSISQLSNNFLRIGGSDRWTLDLGYARDSALFETERDIVRTTDGAPYDLIGNVTGSPIGSEIDPALSALYGSPVTSAGVPTSAANGASSLADFGALANSLRSDDLTAYRTLAPRREQGSIAGSLKRDLNENIAATVSASLEDTSTLSYLGLPGISLTLPGTSPYSPFGDDVLLHRYVDMPDALRRDVDTNTAKLGAIMDGYMGGAFKDWRWTVTGGYNRVETNTSTGRGLDASALQAAITAGDPAVNPFGDLTGRTSFIAADTARSVSSLLEGELVLTGKAWEGPAGDLQTTLKFGADTRSLDSESLRSGVFDERSLSRDRYNAQGTFNIPLTSRSREFMGGIGDISANLNLAYEDVSDFGGLETLGLGLNWSPVEPLNLSFNYSDEKTAPSIQQLNDPTVFTPNVPVFDFATGQTVNITRIEGGNLGLEAEHKKVLRIGANYRPFSEMDLRLTANYTRTEINGSIASFPTITPELEAALPERFVRDSDGRLLSIDARPLNFQSAEKQELRWGFNFSRPFGKPNEAAASQMRIPGAGGPPPGGAMGGAPGGAPGAGPGAGPRGPGGMGAGPRARSSGPSMQPGQGRFNISLNHTWRFQDEINIRDGLPVLDLLDGAAVGSRGGQPRHEVQLQAGVFRSGMGAFLNANWKAGTEVTGDSQTLKFSDQTTVNLNMFADLSSRTALVEQFPWLKGARVSFGIENLFDDRLSVRNDQGAVPLTYQPDYLDPMGRTFRISLRKILF